VKGKTFPLKMIIDGLSWYNMGYSLEDSCNFLKEHYGHDVQPTTLSNWLEEFGKLCTYSRMREFGKKLYTPNQIIQSVTLFHRQVYRYRYHRAKAELCLQEFRNARLSPLKEYLEAVMAECPHQLFRDGGRASDNAKFDLSQLIVNERFNFAVRLAQFVLQAVNNNRERHEILQKFMLANDSVTVAAEVPVYIDSDDIDHMKIALGFEIPDIFGRSAPDVDAGLARSMSQNTERDDAKEATGHAPNDGQDRQRNGRDGTQSAAATAARGRRIITGHIDILQIRNGSVHIMDYKPGAKKVRPIEQLTIYALALSRLTGLRMFDFKCAWFDDKNYYEFFPLHVVYKKGRMRIPREQVRLNQINADGEKFRQRDNYEIDEGMNAEARHQRRDGGDNAD